MGFYQFLGITQHIQNIGQYRENTSTRTFKMIYRKKQIGQKLITDEYVLSFFLRKFP